MLIRLLCNICNSLMGSNNSHNRNHNRNHSNICCMDSIYNNMMDSNRNSSHYMDNIYSLVHLRNYFQCLVFLNFPLIF